MKSHVFRQAAPLLHPTVLMVAYKTSNRILLSLWWVWTRSCCLSINMASPGRGNLLPTQELPISLPQSQSKECTPEHGTWPCGLTQRHRRVLHTHCGPSTAPKVLCALSYLVLVSPLLGRQFYSVTFARGFQWGNEAEGGGLWWCKAQASGSENSESMLLCYDLILSLWVSLSVQWAGSLWGPHWKSLVSKDTSTPDICDYLTESYKRQCSVRISVMTHT